MKLKSKHSVLSFSGGLDSTSLLLHLLNQNQVVHCVSFIYGQNHSLEVDKAKKNISYMSNNGFSNQLTHKVIDITNIFENFSSSLLEGNNSIPEGHYESDNMKTTFVPNRNAIFCSIIYGYALSVSKKLNKTITISMGAHSGDHEIYPDCRIDFFKELFNSFKIGNWESEKINLYLPYIYFTKKEILLDAKKSLMQLSLDFDTIFKNTITSYNPDKKGYSSGKSGSDIERILAFNAIGMKDPINYIDEWDKVLSHAIRVDKKFKKKL